MFPVTVGTLSTVNGQVAVACPIPFNEMHRSAEIISVFPIIFKECKLVFIPVDLWFRQ